MCLTQLRIFDGIPILFRSFYGHGKKIVKYVPRISTGFPRIPTGIPLGLPGNLYTGFPELLPLVRLNKFIQCDDRVYPDSRSQLIRPRW